MIKSNENPYGLIKNSFSKNNFRYLHNEINGKSMNEIKHLLNSFVVLYNTEHACSYWVCYSRDKI